MGGLRANRDARLLIAGQILSTLGDSALWLALGIWVKQLTGSASAAGLAFFAFTLGNLAAPLGGWLADRVRRRPLLIAANLGTAALVLPLLLVHDAGQVWLVYAVMFGYGLSAAVIGPAQTSLQQAVLAPELLGTANSAVQTAKSGLRLVTPLLGAGLLAAVGPVPVILGDVLTFLVATATLRALRLREQRPGRNRRAELLAGARHLRNTVALRRLMLAGVLAVTAFGLSETVLFDVVSEGLHRPDAFLGVLISGQGAGAVLAGVTAPALLRRCAEHRLVALGLTAAGAGFLLQAVPSTSAVLTGSVLIGAALPWISVGILTCVQLRTPAGLMGRTDAALNLALTVPQTVAIAAGAGLLTLTGYRTVLFVIALLMLLATLPATARQESPDDGQRVEAVDHHRRAEGQLGLVHGQPQARQPDEQRA
ncbi:MFS transporter [Kitasatospora sp. NPDC002227]|uniref:MFS transporter n=1 Tax=Kitasatospora sp. NPDC002227 TaxID=3154773 RepID=UPI003327D5E1